MQEPFRNKKSRGYRLRPASGRDRLDSRVRRICSRLGILAVVVAAAIVIRSLYNIQIIHGAEYRQYAAQQQLLDTTIKATRGEIYDASGITLASTSVVWTIWADPSYSSILYTSKTNDDDTVTKTLDPAMCAEVSRELTLRLLSGDGRKLGQRGHFLGRVSAAVPDRLRCTFPAGFRLRHPCHQGEQRGEAFH